MILTQVNKDAIRRHTEICDPEEACGLILDIYGENRIFPCKNNSDIKSQRFSIDSFDYFKASKLGKIIASYHSHTDNNDKFSILDKINSEGHKLVFVLYCLFRDSFSIYDPKGYEFPYLGRPFKMGERDCFTLVIDYYKRELGIDIKNYKPDRKDGFFLENPSFFSKKDYLTMAAEQKLEIVSASPEEHDILFMKVGNHTFPSHLAIYLGAGKILHQPRNCSSKLDDFASVAKDVIFILRRKHG